MKISVKVKPGSKKSGLEKGSDDIYTAYIKEQPEKGRANKELIEVLAEYFGVPKSAVYIKTGHKARIKIVEIKK